MTAAELRRRLARVSAEKDTAALKEDFERAAICKSVLLGLQALQGRFEELTLLKAEALHLEEYVAADEAKRGLDALFGDADLLMKRLDPPEEQAWRPPSPTPAGSEDHSPPKASTAAAGSAAASRRSIAGW